MRKSRLSYTAEKIAKSMYLFGQDPVLASLLPSTTYDLSDRLCDDCELWGPVSQKMYYSQSMVKFSSWTARGAWFYLPLRKRYIRDQVIAAIEQGARQVVNIGAGFDVLLLSLSREYPHVKFIEIDHPNTSRVKRKGAISLPECSKNMKFVAADLSVTSLAKVLEKSGFDSSVPAVFIAEGLLPYLKEDAVKALFSAIEDNAASGSRFIFSYCIADDKGNIAIGSMSKLSTGFLKLIGEPMFFWKAPAAMERFVKDIGLDVLDHPEPEALADKYLDGSPYTVIERFMSVTN